MLKALLLYFVAGARFPVQQSTRSSLHCVNAADSDRDNCFSKSRLIHSPWNDLGTESQNDFCILGDSPAGRSFYVNKDNSSCDGDIGWFMASSGKTSVRSRPAIPIRSSCTVNLLLAATGMISVRSVTLFNSHLRRIELHAHNNCHWLP